MGRVFLRIVLALLVLSSSVRAQPQYSDPEQAIRRVIATAGDTRRILKGGTGFHVGGGIVYTNAHVVTGEEIPDGARWYLASKTSTSDSGTWLGPFRVTCVHPRWRYEVSGSGSDDVAQLKMENAPQFPQFPSLIFHDSPPVTGQRVTVKGFPKDSQDGRWRWPPILHTATGRITQVNPQHQTFMIEIESGLAGKGSSGSPVLTDDGRVLGIIVGGHEKSQLALFGSTAVDVCPPW